MSENENLNNKNNNLEISPSNYDWTARIITLLRKRLSINIKLHDDSDHINSGQIFLFNHFARFETFIPQYLIHQQTGAYCRSIASTEFFGEDDAFGNYLSSLGAVPNDEPRLLPFLAEETLHGRKIVIFPEGGMVKDRQVIDDEGDYNIFSKTSGERGMHHMGAAALGIMLEVFKIGLRNLQAQQQDLFLDEWSSRLGFTSSEQLVNAIKKPTQIISANITFYPIRLSENLLQKGVEIFTSNLSDIHLEELLIEGNLLLKNTDMDIRFATPIEPSKLIRWWEKYLIRRVFKTLKSIDDLFEMPVPTRWEHRVLSRTLLRKISQCRKLTMEAMYEKVTINLSHLASLLILDYVDRGVMEVSCEDFNKALYLSIKYVQKAKHLHLHRSLLQPALYCQIIGSNYPELDMFIKTAETAELIEHSNIKYYFLPKLLKEHDFDEIRLENPILVSVNEAEPTNAPHIVSDAAKNTNSTTIIDLIHYYFDDEIIRYRNKKSRFSAPKYDAINRQETATQSGIPYLLRPPTGSPNKNIGIVLVHGFLASPAELRSFGDKLLAEGYTVIGVRLSGHGTSPHDLNQCSWQDWLESVKRGYEIISMLTWKVCLVGFSTGGTLALRLASETTSLISGVCAVSSPIKFMNKNLVFVPFLHGANKLASLLSPADGVIPFRQNESEHPDINYSNIPVHGLNELVNLVNDAENQLSSISCPVKIIQGTDDQVVDPVSAQIIYDKIGSDQKSIEMITSNRHGILNENIGGTQKIVIDFIKSLE